MPEKTNEETGDRRDVPHISAPADSPTERPTCDLYCFFPAGLGSDAGGTISFIRKKITMLP